MVQYDKQKYSGEITDVMNKKVVVSTMYPAERMNAFTHLQLLLRKSTPPEIAGRRRQFLFDYFN